MTPAIKEKNHLTLLYLTEVIDEAVGWTQRGPVLGHVHPGQAIEQHHIKVFMRAL